MESENQYKIVSHALRHTEDQIDGSLMHLSASETRMAQISMFCASLAALLAASSKLVPSIPVALITACVFVISAFLGMWSIRPRNVDVKGHVFSEWKPHLADNDCIIEVLASQAEENDCRIRRLERELERLGKRTNQVLLIAYLAFCFFIGGQIRGALI